MTPLDQAFAKAFSQRDPTRPLPPHATRAVPLEALGTPVNRRVVVHSPAGGQNLLAELSRAPAQLPAKPSGAVPAPHFALRRPTQSSEPEFESAPGPEPESQAELEPKFEPQLEPAVEPMAAEPPPEVNIVIEPQPPLPTAAAEPAPEIPAASVPENFPTPLSEEPLPASHEPAAVVDEPAPDESEAGFSPALQVDHFAWPANCIRLVTSAYRELDQLAEALKQTHGRRKAVAVTAPVRGGGATTVLLCVAQRLAMAGVPTVAVDVDLVRPQLGQMLGLEPEAAWEEVLAGREPLDEALIESIEDRMVVLPLTKPVGPSRELPGRVAQSLATLCEHYQSVLLNLGPPDDWWVLGDLVDRRLAEQIGLLVAVCDARQTDDQLDRLCRKANAAGIDQVVLVENFVASSRPLAPSP